MEDKKYKFEFNENEATIILKALEELPFKISANVRQSLVNQFNAQASVKSEDVAIKEPIE